MEMCRVCLSTEKEMLPLDETFINSYNLLTNLNVSYIIHLMYNHFDNNKIYKEKYVGINWN